MLVAHPLNLALSQYSAKTVMERIFDDQAALNRQEEREAKGLAALKSSGRKRKDRNKREKKGLNIKI